MGGMKRLAVLLFALIALVGVLSSHGNSHKADSATGSTALTGPTRLAPHHVAHSHYTACDQNISAGPHTTCGFADNVFRAFAHEAAQGSEEASVTATSLATGKAYVVRCGTTHGVTVCTGGSDARVRFPLWAAKVYNKPAKSENESNASAPSTEPEQATPGSSSGSEESGAGSGGCCNGTYVHSSGDTGCKPEESPTAPTGATARCADGTYSFSEHRSGTCSYHGGVAEWLDE
jgi:hypothetical protein